MLDANPKIDILLVEDSPGDVMLVTAELMRSSGINSVLIVDDGNVALDVLHRRGACSHAPRPHLILLDLDLPTIGGREVLRRIKSDPDLKSIPVIILTTSGAEVDRLMARRLDADGFVTKPSSPAEYARLVASLEHFWVDPVAPRG